MFVGETSHTLAWMLARAAPTGAVVGSAIAAFIGSDDFDLVLGAIIGSVGVSGLATLWKVWTRTRRLIEFVLDKGFDRLERRVGMEPGDFDEGDVDTPMDDLMED